MCDDKTKGDKSILIMNHTLAHILAYSLQKLFPSIKLYIGPATEEGFYYDFKVPNISVSVDDFDDIKKEMIKIIDLDLKISRSETSFVDSIKGLDDEKGEYKKVILNEIVGKDAVVSSYKMGDFVDICEGPHLSSTGSASKHFYIDTISGAYIRGDSKRDMLQRISVISLGNEKKLKVFLKNRELARQADHRLLNKELDLFVLEPNIIGPGLAMLTENGTVIKSELEFLATEKERRFNLLRVFTPHIAKEKLFLKSGHLPYYKEDMYPPFKIDDEDIYLKAMNCPLHHYIFSRHNRSYREMPIRYTEFSTVYRYEASGSLSGLMRVRAITQNDIHIYSREDQVVEEFRKIIQLHKEYYNLLGIKSEDFFLELSLPDDNKDKFIEDDSEWKKTAEFIREAVKLENIEFKEVQGEAAFYGPKADFQVKSAIGTVYAISTSQVDFAGTKRFDLTFVNDKGENEKVYVIHAAPLGSYERTIGFLTEHFVGAFPLWLAPIQVVVMAVSDKFQSYLNNVFAMVSVEFVNNATRGIRCNIDKSDERLAKKIRNSTRQKVPYIVVVGENEEKSNTVSVRTRGSNKSVSMPLEKFVQMIKSKIESRDINL
ncbi:MAG: threonine--tRNA ligase [Alphaproteobacteria bacterium]|nr:threonine--tRNA ligase [Alphaproteobacteria bacterium]MBL0718004.1 threonine--tRNA ligase [Alphaproteobacteria bacterium]